MWPVARDGVLAPDREVLRSWRSHPEPFHAVVLLLDSADVERRRRQVARALHPWCWVQGPAHVTLVACGGHPGAQSAAEVSLKIGGADSFPAAAFLHVAGPGLRELRERILADIPEVDPEPVWTPHVTVGTYRWPLPQHHLVRRLQALRELPALPATGRLAVATVDKRTGGLRRC